MEMGNKAISYYNKELKLRFDPDAVYNKKLAVEGLFATAKRR
jgi:hypothetical protein